MKRALKQLIRNNCESLVTSDRDFESIYNIIFSMEDFVLCESSDGYRILKTTYKQAKDIIANVAFFITEQLKVTDEYIGIDLENGLEWIVSFWAILMSGNKPYLINRRYPKALLEKVSADINLKYVISSEDASIELNNINYDSLLCTGHEDFEGCFADTIALSTSATSLNAVICIYSGREIAEQILNTEFVLIRNKQISKFYNGSLKQLAFLPFYHIFGLTAVYFWFTFFGRTFVFLKDYSGDTITKTCRKHEVTHIFAVPLLWHTIEAQVKKEVHEKGEKTEQKFYKGLALSTCIQNIFPALGIKIAHLIFKEVTSQLFGNSLNFCISGGGYLKDSSIYMMNALGYPMHNGFGMTEVGITSVELGNKPSSRNKNSVGKPFPSIQYKINDDGILTMSGTSICSEIIVNGKSHTPDEWFNTGDFARIDEDGCYYINGRLSDVIIGDNGENINPDLIEKQFSFNSVQNFCIFGKKSNSQEVVAMVIQVNKYISPTLIDNIIKSFHEQNNSLPLTSGVKELYFTFDKIASESAIKVSRQFLLRGIENEEIKLIPLKEIKSLQAETTDNCTQNPELVKSVTTIFSNYVNTPIEEIKPDMHLFFDLGASSLDYFSIVAHINETFNVKLYLKEEDCCYTVSDFCREIEKRI